MDDNNDDDDDDDDNEETANEEITPKDTRIILGKLKEAVQKYGDDDTFQLFQKLHVCTINLFASQFRAPLPVNYGVSVGNIL